MKYRFLEALDKIVGTDRKINRTDSLDIDGFWMSYDGEILKSDDNCEVVWPSLEHQKAKIWEVEPEAIYVWGLENSSGESWLTTSQNLNTPDTRAYFKGKVFSNSKPQKYKLVPVDDE